MKSTFRADWLPSWENYANAHDLALLGHGDERRAVCAIHNGTRASLAINVSTGRWHCHSCSEGGGDVLAFHMARHGLRFVDAAKDLGAWEDGDTRAPAPAVLAKAAPRPVEAPQHVGLSDEARTLLDACSGLERTVGEEYLRARCCVLPPSDSDLRFHPRLHHPSGYVGPALVGLVSDALDARILLTLHFTWICADGTKAKVDTPRRFLAGHTKRGGVVRLWPDEYLTGGLGIAEGIESALSLAHAFTPVWACLDAGNLSKFAALPGVGELVIGADNDPAGVDASNACAKRWADAGARVRIAMPPQPGADMNDLARGTPT